MQCNAVESLHCNIGTTDTLAVDADRWRLTGAGIGQSPWPSGLFCLLVPRLNSVSGFVNDHPLTMLFLLGFPLINSFHQLHSC